MKQNITWFEVPAVDFDRAVAFYSTILDLPIQKGVFQGAPHGFLPAGAGIVSGAIVVREDLQPSPIGTVIYFDVGRQMQAVLGRVEAAGGAILTPEMPIDPQGTCAFIRDTEGNRIGLHSPPIHE